MGTHQLQQSLSIFPRCRRGFDVRYGAFRHGRYRIFRNRSPRDTEHLDVRLPAKAAAARTDIRGEGSTTCYQEVAFLSTGREMIENENAETVALAYQERSRYHSPAQSQRVDLKMKTIYSVLVEGDGEFPAT